MLLNRAKHLYSDEYFISDSIKFTFSGTQIYLYDHKKHRWVECEQETRSIHFPDMIDNEGTKIFASLSEDGKGGDTYNISSHLVTFVYRKLKIEVLSNGNPIGNLINHPSEIKVTGIQQ